jgi:hypothetical protein
MSAQLVDKPGSELKEFTSFLLEYKLTSYCARGGKDLEPPGIETIELLYGESCDKHGRPVVYKRPAPRFGL